ncbi:MAG: winged helix-turn-helix transcriptional regulator [Methanomicrobiales archaeon]|nr:winged helix-turn-helix transcriptional regulator [Methanomicrobiales archaeon]
MTAPAKSPGRSRKPGIIDEIPKDIAVSLTEAGGLPWLCSLIPAESSLHDQVVIHKALADPLRLKILFLLSAQPLCVCVIKHCLRIADSKLSYHLSVLKEAGLVESRHDKNWLIYSLTSTGKTVAEQKGHNSP